MHVECEEASSKWEWWEWEEFFPGDMPRPGSQAAREAEERDRRAAEAELAEAIRYEELHSSQLES
jgi:hypothetical protein